MKTPDYKTLLYMQGLGSPVDEWYPLHVTYLY